MTTAQVVETSFTNNSLSKGYPHPEEHDKQIADTPGFKPFTNNNNNNNNNNTIFTLLGVRAN